MTAVTHSDSNADAFKARTEQKAASRKILVLLLIIVAVGLLKWASSAIADAIEKADREPKPAATPPGTAGAPATPTPAYTDPASPDIWYWERFAAGKLQPGDYNWEKSHPIVTVIHFTPGARDSKPVDLSQTEWIEVHKPKKGRLDFINITSGTKKGFSVWQMKSGKITHSTPATADRFYGTVFRIRGFGSDEKVRLEYTP